MMKSKTDGGAIAGGTNAWLSGNNFIEGAVGGGVSSAVGGMVGKWASKGGNIMINRVNITSPVGKGVFGGGIGGFLSGYTSSFVSTGMSNDWNLQESHRAGLDGAINGAFMGAMSGGVSSYRYANKNNINPWTGRPKKGIVIGRDMVNRVNPTAGNMGIETISNDWNNATQNDFNNDMLAGKQFNKEWLSVKIEEGYAVFDIGEGSYPIGTNYGMELRCLHGYTNIYPTHIIVLFRHISIIYYYGPTMY